MLAAALRDLAGDGSQAAALDTVTEAVRRLARAETAALDSSGEAAESDATGHMFGLTIWLPDDQLAHILLEREEEAFDHEERRLAQLAVAGASLVLMLADADTNGADAPATRDAERVLPQLAELTTFASLAAAAAAAAGADGAVLARLSAEEQQLELIGVAGMSEKSIRVWRRQPLSGDSALAEAVRAGRTVHASGALLPGDRTIGSGVAIPLVASGRLLGALGLDYAAVRTFDDADRIRLEALGRQTAEAFDSLEHDVFHDLVGRLHDLTEALAASHSRRDIADVIVAQGIGALGAIAGSVVLLEAQSDRLRIVASHGYPGELVAAFDALPLDFPAAIADVVRTGAAVVLESPEEFDERYPEVRAVRGRPAEHAAVALPLVAGDEPFGVLAFSFPGTRVFDHDERGFLLALSRLCAQALDSANQALLYDRTARLQAVTAQLGKALTPGDVGRTVIDEAFSALGACGGRVVLRDPATGVATTIAIAGYPADFDGGLRGADNGPIMPLEAAILRNETVLVESLTTARDEWPLAAAVLARHGNPAVAAVPLCSRGDVIGAIGFVWSEERRFLEEDVSFLGALAGVCAQALDRALLYDDSERIRDRLRHLLDHLGEAVIAVDSGLRVTYANEEAAQIFGGGPHVGRLLPDRWPELALRGIVKSQLTVDSEPVDERVTLSDGRTFEVVAMPDAGGATLVLRDISRWERQERAEREFVANAAHELRTPLAAIAAAADALQRGAKDMPSERDYYIGGVVSEVDRLVRLSESLLLLARAQADPQVLRRERIELEPLLTDVAARLEVRPGVRVVVDCDDSAILGERALLDGALTNVARNASRHTKVGTISLSCRAVGTRVVIEIADTGVGMSEEVRARAADRFFRGVQRNRDGFGLGLAMAQEMVHAVEGELEIVSRRGGGTTIKITLDAA
jgi:signal transduction histidine kinase